MATSHPRVAVDCHVRPSLFVEPVDDTIETLREYSEQQVVDELVVEPWPDEIRLGEKTEHGPFQECYNRFRQWADRHGASLEPGFLQRERTTLVSEGRDTVLSPPVVCLAIEVDGELVSVAPHDTGAGAYTVEDALADIEGLTEGATARVAAVPTGTHK